MNKGGYLRLLREAYGAEIPQQFEVSDSAVQVIDRCMKRLWSDGASVGEVLRMHYGLQPYNKAYAQSAIASKTRHSVYYIPTSIKLGLNRLNTPDTKTTIFSALGLFRYDVPEGTPAFDWVPVQFASHYKDLLVRLMLVDTSDNVLVDKRLKAVIDTQINRLSSDQRDVVHMRFGLSGKAMSSKAVAEALELDIKTVYNYFFQGCSRLRTIAYASHIRTAMEEQKASVCVGA